MNTMEGRLRAIAASPRPRVGRVAKRASSNRHALGASSGRRGRVASSREFDARRLLPNARHASAETSAYGGGRSRAQPCTPRAPNFCTLETAAALEECQQDRRAVEPERGIREWLTPKASLTTVASSVESCAKFATA